MQSQEMVMRSSQAKSVMQRQFEKLRIVGNKYLSANPREETLLAFNIDRSAASIGECKNATLRAVPSGNF